MTEELRGYLIGWKGYYRLAQTPRKFSDADEWIRRRLRAVQLKQWKNGTTVYRELIARDVPRRQARGAAEHVHRWWRMSAHQALQMAWPSRHFDELGVPRLAA